MRIQNIPKKPKFIPYRYSRSLRTKRNILGGPDGAAARRLIGLRSFRYNKRRAPDLTAERKIIYNVTYYNCCRNLPRCRRYRSSEDF